MRTQWWVCFKYVVRKSLFVQMTCDQSPEGSDGHFTNSNGERSYA